jgi:ABC-type Na+ efflux pump permease subunit
MNKIWLIFQREFLNRVQKKSFLIATILIPLIFPAIIAVMIMVMLKQEEDSGAQKIQVVDVSGKFSFENSRRYEFVKVSTDLETAKAAFNKSDDFALRTHRGLRSIQRKIQVSEGLKRSKTSLKTEYRISSLSSSISTRPHSRT